MIQPNENIAIELKATLEIPQLTDDEFQEFVSSGVLPEVAWDCIKEKFFSSLICGYAYIDGEQQYLNI